ncbi:MAG TPA: M48 family metallopeptidase [bacterium]|nr:M48 family metallopeptidase [bacterium]
MMRFGRALALTLSLLLLWVPAAGAQNTVSREQELAAGRYAAARLIAEYPLLVDADWLAFLGQLRDALQPFSGRPDIPHQVLLLETETPNAISTPGYLFFTAGLLRLGLDRDGWAFVMAHELAHTARRHVAIEIEKAQAAAVLNVLVAVLSGSAAAGDLAELLMRVANLGHARELEVEADVEGYKMAVQAGFDPERAAATLRVFNEATGRRQERTHWAGTHPGFAERIDRLGQARQRLLEQGFPQRVIYFTVEGAAGGLRLRPVRMVETVRDWTFLVEAANDTASGVEIANTAVRLALADGRTIDQVFLRGTLPDQVGPRSRTSGTVVFERPDPAARPVRLLISAAGVELALPVSGGGPFRAPATPPALPRPPSP